MNEKINPLDLGEDYRKVLNRHGYAFQYSVIRFVDDLYTHGQPEWELEASEYPVSVRSMQTRIDFILRKRKPLVYLIAECKRANPAFSNWCFAGSPYARRNSGSDRVVFQYAWVPPSDTRSIEVKPLDPTKRMLTGVISVGATHVYQVGLSVKSNQTGDKAGKTNDAIEDAAGQVCKGLNGLIEFFHSQREKLPQGEKLYFLPVIFTTAKLWTTEVDLASASIDKGEFESGSVALKETSWIWYQYNLSPALKHTLPTDGEDSRNPFDLSSALEQEFTRSIAIVCVKGIQEFLHHGFPFR
jgi:hypothetical protein